ncbi:MAG: arylesterase [Emcibacter sp.]|nr:arylesterase [Emcibacter sp.]
MTVLKTIKMFATSLLFIAINASIVMANNYTVLVFGDSLTAGYGLFPEQSFTAQLEQKLKQDGYAVTVINASVSGDTSSGGVARLPWVLSGTKPDLVIVELGANDALRGIAPEITRANMDIILSYLNNNKIKTIVAGMLSPPNMGAEYSAEFNRIFPELSTQYNHMLYPFFLEDVAGEPSLNQYDAMHPNAEGVAVIVSKIMPYILKALAIPSLIQEPSSPLSQ